MKSPEDYISDRKVGGACQIHYLDWNSKHLCYTEVAPKDLTKRMPEALIERPCKEVLTKQISFYTIDRQLT